MYFFHIFISLVTAGGDTKCYYGIKRFVWVIVLCFCCTIFRLDALALSVIATATWLAVAGWVAGWLSHSGIVSKSLNLSENFLDHLKAPSL